MPTRINYPHPIRAADYPRHTRVADVAKAYAARGYRLHPTRRGLIAVRVARS